MVSAPQARDFKLPHRPTLPSKGKRDNHEKGEDSPDHPETKPFEPKDHQ
jgi:hypothetical protein